MEFLQIPAVIISARSCRRGQFLRIWGMGRACALCETRKSIDTTMGLTPTGGIPMGTRSGDLDPGVLLYLLRNDKLDVDGLEHLVNHRSGLFALSGGESDVKVLPE